MSALETIVLTQNNLKTVCRICLEKKPHLFSFRDAVSIEGEKFNPTIIGDMLCKLAVGHIRQEKGFSKKICTKCVSLLQAAYVFQLKLQESTKILQFFMITTCDGQFQDPHNTSNSTKPVEKDSAIQNVPTEGANKPTMEDESAIQKELQQRKVQKPNILRKTEPGLVKNSPGKANGDQPIQLLFPANFSFKVQSLVENPIFRTELKVVNIPPSNGSKNAQTISEHPTIQNTSTLQKPQIVTQYVLSTDGKNQNISVLNEPTEKANLRKPQVKNTLRQKVSRQAVVMKTLAPQNVSIDTKKNLENQQTVVKNHVQKVCSQNILSNAKPVVETSDELVDLVGGETTESEVETEMECNKLEEYGKENDNTWGIIQVTPKATPVSHTCPICIEQFPTPIELKKHVHNHKGLKKHLSIAPLEQNVKFYAKPRDNVSLFSRPLILHTCPHCNKQLPGCRLNTHLNNHIKQGRFKCNQCDRVFRRINNLNMHRIQHLKEHPYWCNNCEKGFVIKRNYDCHMLTHTVSVTQLPHECPHCFKRFANPQHLHRHKMIHTDKITYNNKYKVNRCKKCLECFKNDAQLSNHTCTPTEITMTTRFPCKFCKKVFKHAAGLYCHISYVHKQKKRITKHGLCQICGQFVKHIVSHMVIHTVKEKTHQCVLCGKKFITLSRLKQHILIHTREKQFKCEHCEKRFPTKQRLDRHFMRMHSTLRPYACGICAKTFNDVNNLRVHERIHTGVKNHRCAICDKGFSERAYLKKHYSNVHKVINFD